MSQSYYRWPPPTAPIPQPFIWDVCPLAVAEERFDGRSGVYRIYLRFSEHLLPIDVGLSTDAGDRLQNHPRYWEWVRRQLDYFPLPPIEAQLIETPAWGVDPDVWRRKTERMLRDGLEAQRYRLCGVR